MSKNKQKKIFITGKEQNHKHHSLLMYTPIPSEPMMEKKNVEVVEKDSSSRKFRVALSSVAVSALVIYSIFQMSSCSGNGHSLQNSLGDADQYVGDENMILEKPCKEGLPSIANSGSSHRGSHGKHSEDHHEEKNDRGREEKHEHHEVKHEHKEDQKDHRGETHQNRARQEDLDSYVELLRRDNSSISIPSISSSRTPSSSFESIPSTSSSSTSVSVPPPTSSETTSSSSSPTSVFVPPTSSSEETSSSTFEEPSTSNTPSTSSSSTEQSSTEQLTPTSTEPPSRTSAESSTSHVLTTFSSVDNGRTVIVTSTQVITNQGNAATGTSTKNTSGGGLSKTNQIVVGVVVGVGGSILIAIVGLFFYYRRRSTDLYAGSGGWTFWRKGEKTNEDFLNGELGVRDRNINTGSNF